MNSTEKDIQQDLHKYLLQEDISPEEVKELASLSNYIEYPAETIILKEGDTNTRLYFLLEGSVGVFHGNEKIATLSTPGDLLGEMSLITGKPCSASTVANSKVSVLILDISKTKQMSTAMQTVFSSALHRIFSKILAQKLAITNEKARLFEITNRELEIARKAVELASHERLDQMAESHSALFKKLHEIYSGELQTVQQQFSQMEKDQGLEKNPQASQQMKKISQSLHSLSKSLEPYASIHQFSEAAQSKKVLFVEENMSEQINAKMALGGTGLAIAIASNIEEATAMLKDQPYDILCMSSTMTDLIPAARSSCPGIKCVLLTSGAISDHFQTLKSSPELSTIVVRHPEDRAFTLKNMASTIQKLATKDLFGMEKYLAWGTVSREHVVANSTDREALIGQMTDYFGSLGIREPLTKRCSQVCEELLLNAIYDAPTDVSGKQLYKHLDRKTPVTLPPDQQAMFRYACDGSLLAVSVEDRFGALSRPMIINYLEKCFGQGDAEGAVASTGEGNGIFQMILLSSLVVFNVKPRARTEVIALFNINIQLNKVRTHPSFHFFEVDA